MELSFPYREFGLIGCTQKLVAVLHTSIRSLKPKYICITCFALKNTVYAFSLSSPPWMSHEDPLSLSYVKKKERIASNGVTYAKPTPPNWDLIPNNYSFNLSQEWNLKSANLELPGLLPDRCWPRGVWPWLNSPLLASSFLVLPPSADKNLSFYTATWSPFYLLDGMLPDH